jgi:hypothetical protein
LKLGKRRPLPPATPSCRQSSRCDDHASRDQRRCKRKLDKPWLQHDEHAQERTDKI